MLKLSFGHGTLRYLNFCSIIFNKFQLHQFTRNNRIACHNALSGYSFQFDFQYICWFDPNLSWLVYGASHGGEVQKQKLFLVVVSLYLVLGELVYDVSSKLV